MKPLFPLFALTAAILTACPAPMTAPAGTAVPSSGGTVSSSDTQASLVAPSATSGTFINVTASSDQGSIPSGQTFIKAYGFQVTAGSVASATISIQVDQPVSKSSVSILKGNAINRLYKRDGAFWRYVTGQTSTSSGVSAVVSSYGVYGVLQGIATIKDIVVTPSSVNLTVGQTQQMTALVRDSLDQPMPTTDAEPISWILESATLASVQALQNTISATGLFTANSAGQDKIIAITNQNVKVRVPVTVTNLVK